MEETPRNLRTMLAEAKDTSELMVDLAYASVYFGDPDMAEEVDGLEQRMSDLVHDMRAVCVLSARSSKEAEGMSSVLQVISAIERIANDAVDIARIVTHKLGIPPQLVADLSDAEEVSHRVSVSEGSHMANRVLSFLELPVQAGMRVMSIRRGNDWIIDVDGETVLVPGDVLFLRCSPDGITRLREMAAAPIWEPPKPEENDNLSETAVGLAYSAIVLADRGLAAEVRHLEDLLDEMKDHLELWVLRSALGDVEPEQLRGLLHLAEAAEDIGDQAQAMVWLVEKEEELHPILEIALGEAEEVVVRYPVASGCSADGVSLSDLGLNIEPGFTILAIRRGEGYLYQPRGKTRLTSGDEIIASGPEEGQALLARLCGWELVQDDEGKDELKPIDG